MTHSYAITGMTCTSCVGRVKSELLKLPDVIAAEIQLQSPQATITMQRHINDAVLQGAIHKAGAYTLSAGGTHQETSVTESSSGDSYYPIFLLFGYITGVTLLVQFASGNFHLMQWMTHFMGGFFIVFSFFKLLNIKGFAEGYRTYDIVAKTVPAYGFVYPFLELALGIAFILGFKPVFTNVVTLAVMAVSSVGVIQSLLKKTPFQCACLGTIIKLPLSKVTLFEDLLMVLMSAAMLVTLLT